MTDYIHHLLEHITLTAHTIDDVHVLDIPGFNVKKILTALPEDVRERVHLVGPEHDMSALVPQPIPDALEHVELDTELRDILTWIPSLHVLFGSTHVSYGGTSLDVKNLRRHPMCAPFIRLMEDWLTRITPELYQHALLLATGPKRVLMSDLESLISRDVFLDLVQVGLGRVDGAWFEFNGFARHVLCVNMTDDERYTCAKQIDTLLFPADMMGIWPESMIGNFDYSQTSGRHMRFAEFVVHDTLRRADNDTTSVDPAQLVLALRASAFLGYVANMKGANKRNRAAHQQLLSMTLDRQDIDPLSMAMALDSLLKNYKSLLKEQDPAHILEQAFTFARQANSDALIAHLNVSRADLIFRTGQLEESLKILEHCSAQNLYPTTQVMVSSQLARLQKDDVQKLRVMDEAIRISIEHSLVYCEFIARAYKIVWGISQNHEEQPRLQLQMLDNLIAENDVGLVLQADLHWLHGMYWRAQKNTEEAIKSYTQVAMLFNQLDRTFEQGVLHEAWGKLYLENQQFDKAYHYLDLAQGFYIHTEENTHYENRALAWKTYSLLKNTQLSSEEYQAHLRQVPEVLNRLDSLSKKARQALQFDDVYQLLRQELDQNMPRVKVAADGSHFITVDQDTVTLDHRLLLQHMLRALIKFGTQASAAELIPEVWPDEQMTLQSGKNRVRVAISTLRKLGLGDCIQYDSTTQQYKLDVDVIHID